MFLTSSVPLNFYIYFYRGDIFPSNDIKYNESALLVLLISYIFIMFYTKKVLYKLETYYWLCTDTIFFRIETLIKADFFCVFSKFWGQIGTTGTHKKWSNLLGVFFLTLEHYLWEKGIFTLIKEIYFTFSRPRWRSLTMLEKDLLRRIWILMAVITMLLLIFNPSTQTSLVLFH